MKLTVKRLTQDKLDRWQVDKSKGTGLTNALVTVLFNKWKGADMFFSQSAMGLLCNRKAYPTLEDLGIGGTTETGRTKRLGEIIHQATGRYEWIGTQSNYVELICDRHAEGLAFHFRPPKIDEEREARRGYVLRDYAKKGQDQPRQRR